MGPGPLPSAVGGSAVRVRNRWLGLPAGPGRRGHVAPLHRGHHVGADHLVGHQAGAVLGSAGIAVLIQARLAANLPGAAIEASSLVGARLPAALNDGFAAAMAQSLYLPAGVLVVGLLAVLCFAAPSHVKTRR